MENELYNHASRLVANCTIAYNAILLSNVYERLLLKYGKEKAEKIMHKISPVAWQHINFVGRYKFLSKGDDINFEINCTSGRNPGRMEKYFPLHHFLINHQVPDLKKIDKGRAIAILDLEGRKLEQNLRKIKNKDITNKKACDEVLCEFVKTSERLTNVISYKRL